LVVDTDLSVTLSRYQRLVELSHDLASTLDLSVLLDRIVHAAASLCSAEAASILLYDEDNQQLYFEAASNLASPQMSKLVVPVESSIAGWILTERKPVIISETRKDPRHFNQIGQATNVQTTSLLGVPMITKDKVIGVLEAINKQVGDFSEEDQEVLFALGTQAAVAIENTRLFQQSDLISEFVHELRTPLASLSAASHLLQRSELKDEQRTIIMATLQREIERLSELATAFLDLARLESGRSQFRVESVDLSGVLNEAATLMRSRAEEKRQVLHSDLAVELPAISGDSDKLKQLVLNLLSNAVKYTPDGGTINLTAQQKDGGVSIEVSDTGVGISPDNLPCIFQKFYRVPGITQSIPGTGLGLSICQRIVEAHRGKIDVRSQVGEGTTFSVFLPLTSAP